MKFFSTVLAFSALAGVTLAGPQRPGGFGRPSAPIHTFEPQSSDSAASNSSPSYGGDSGNSSSGDDSHDASTTAAAATTTAAAYQAAGAATTTTTTTTAASSVICLSTAAASSVVNGFASLLTAYSNATANSLLASDFSDTSDSINFLAGNPLGSVTFPSKLAFEQGQGTQPAIGFNLLNIDAITCTVIAFRWEAILGSGSPVKGINILYTENPTGTEDGWQIQSVFSEFNSAVWTIEIGGTCVPPSQGRRFLH
ncbi:hypothetical protein CLAIMM_10793 [Cladophialophora immunda]|nr:hypothetical protein CLAIMM_10793 [Cladophialophora immunda]